MQHIPGALLSSSWGAHRCSSREAAPSLPNHLESLPPTWMPLPHLLKGALLGEQVASREDAGPAPGAPSHLAPHQPRGRPVGEQEPVAPSPDNHAVHHVQLGALEDVDAAHGGLTDHHTLQRHAGPEAGGGHAVGATDDGGEADGGGGAQLHQDAAGTGGGSPTLVPLPRLLPRGGGQTPTCITPPPPQAPPAQLRSQNSSSS